MKWLTKIFDTTDKEIDRLRRIVAQANSEAEELLDEQRECAAMIREEVLAALTKSGADWQPALRGEIASMATQARRLAGEAETLRGIIEQGEQTSRDLSVLLADAKQLGSMNAERSQRSPVERRELEEEIDMLVAELGEQLAGMMEEKPGLREAILRDVPKASFFPKKAPADEMIKQVEAVAHFLGREVADYFGRTNDTIVALRRSIGLTRLVELTVDGGRWTDDLGTATSELVGALYENDLLKHLARQGLRLPGEVKAAAGIEERQVAPQQNGRNRRGGAPQQVDTPEKDELADTLYWEEQATAELVAIAASVAGGQLSVVSELAERFASREERLQARTAVFRARVLEARTAFWANTWGKIADVAGQVALAPFVQRFAELDEEQDELIDRVVAQDEDKCAPVKIKPDQVGELMRRRDALEATTFNELMNDLRLEDRAAYDRLKGIQEEHKKEQRKDEQRVLNELIPEAFAAVWEASRRTTGMRPYDVQLMGGIVLHEGKISEMKTGEGKTLVAVAPLYLNGLTARGAHLCTVNEYLIKRDADWMGPIYKMLGLSVGAILSGMAPWERRVEYMSDITYGSNSEFGFDYLRDNISNNPDDLVQRVHNYCIVDEVDNILIDEARTPLIISGAAEGSAEVHIRAAGFSKTLREGVDYTMDEKSRSAVLTEEGIDRAEAYFRVDNLYHPDNFQLVYGVDNALKAHALFRRDKDYVLWQEGKVVSAGDRLNPKAPVEVVIVDEFTGRLMQGRRYSEGLHEAIEAKEGIKVQSESQTFATITIQNYFRLYPKLAGMTGTAATEAEEFMKIYKLEVMPIPTHKPMVREDAPDRIYRTEIAKFRAVVDEIEEMHNEGRPVLVGTVSIEKSEELSKMLDERGLTHSVLNAKQHEREASIVAQAGQRGVITIATNMAGRGTDITLGFGVNELGGLHIIGTERHESRRIDNQLRGRAGRQGDSGSSRFYVSIEDEIMRRSGVNQNIINSNLFKSLWEEDMPIEHTMISRSVEQAQVKMEGFNFDIRKHLVEYDDVINTQRDVIYNERRFILRDGDPQSIVTEMIGEKVQEIAAPVQVDSETGRRKKGKAVSGYTEMFGALKETFPEDVIRRLLRSILTSRIAPLAEEGDLEGYQVELEAIAQEAYEGAMETNVKNLDERLRDFYHIGDVYYETAGQGEVDYGKLQRSIGLPNDVISHIRDEEMEYEEALEYLGELAREGFERQNSDALKKLTEYLHAEAPKVVIKDEGRRTNEVIEAKTRALLEYIDGKFALSPVSAGRYAEAESGGRSSSMMAAEGSSEVVEEVQEQLDALYQEIEDTLAEVFIETNETMPLIAMVDNRLPRSVYRQIESRLGLEKLEEIENTPLAQLEPEVRGIVTEAFVRWQESDLLLRVIDYLWTRHLTTMEQLRHSIGLQAYGQKDPLIQYKVKAYELFDDLKAEIRQLSVLNVLMMGGKAEEARAQVKRAAAQSAMEQKARQEAQAGQGSSGKIKGGMGQPRPGQPQAQRPSNGGGNGRPAPRPGQQAPRPGAPAGIAAPSGKQKIGRNDACWCGSGKKYKVCHGR
jgi:preprotein translocase subunit SecA